MMKIFLVRHATPDWEHNDVPYDIQPGPKLSSKGEREAEALADFLKSQGVVRLFYSPFERGARTAQIVAATNGIPSVAEEGLAEWPMAAEPEIHVRQRMSSVFARAARESVELGPIRPSVTRRADRIVVVGTRHKSGAAGPLPNDV